MGEFHRFVSTAPLVETWGIDSRRDSPCCLSPGCTCILRHSFCRRTARRMYPEGEEEEGEEEGEH